MSAIEFPAQTGKTFTLQQYDPIATEVALDGPLAANEGAPGRYRVTSARTGIVYCAATATNLLVTGYANLNRPGANGFSELLDTYDEAYALGSGAAVLPTEVLPKDVRSGVVFVDSGGIEQTGTLELPDEAQVLENIGYGEAGTEFIGQLVALSVDDAGGFPSPVRPDGQLRSPLWIGLGYLTQYGRGFKWRVPAPTNLVAATTTVHFRGRKACSKSLEYAWDVENISPVTEISIEGVAYWEVLFDMPDDITATIQEGTYRWWLTAETPTADVILKQWSSYAPVQWLRG